MSRPTTLTPELAQAIVAHIAAGASFSAACAAAGVPRSTAQSWRKENPMFDNEVAAAEADRGDPLTGRPTLYTQELADRICADIALGMALHQVCMQPGMPGERTVMTWLAKDYEFLKAYRIAREVQAERLSQEVLTLAASATRETLPAIKLMISAMRWRAAQLAPKVYTA